MTAPVMGPRLSRRDGRSALDAALASWPRWRLQVAPRLLWQLTGGLTNASYLLETPDQCLVLRINTPDSGRLGIDRQREQRILARLGACGLAPRVRFCDPDLDILVTEYVEGRQWRPGEDSGVSQWRRLIALMDRVHAIAGDIPGFDYAVQARGYWERLHQLDRMSASVVDAYERVAGGLDRFQRSIAAPVLCHHDPSPLNIIESADGHLLLVDWEYAGAGAAVVARVALARAWAIPDEIMREYVNVADQQWLGFIGDLLDFYDRAWFALRGLPWPAGARGD
jgi:thiamine kinase-like enzyme